MNSMTNRSNIMDSREPVCSRFRQMSVHLGGGGTGTEAGSLKWAIGGRRNRSRVSRRRRITQTIARTGPSKIAGGLVRAGPVVAGLVCVSRSRISCSI